MIKVNVKGKGLKWVGVLNSGVVLSVVLGEASEGQLKDILKVDKNMVKYIDSGKGELKGILEESKEMDKDDEELLKGEPEGKGSKKKKI